MEKKLFNPWVRIADVPADIRGKRIRIRSQQRNPAIRHYKRNESESQQETRDQRPIKANTITVITSNMKKDSTKPHAKEYQTNFLCTIICPH